MKRTPKTAALPSAIVTAALPRLCPSCAHPVAKVDSFGVWKLTCQRCAWSERYVVRP